MAAGALFGSASAGVHKMKLKKVPLSEQLVSGVMFSNATDRRLIAITGGRKHRPARPGSWSEVHGRSPPEAHGRDVQGDFYAR